MVSSSSGRYRGTRLQQVAGFLPSRDVVRSGIPHGGMRRCAALRNSRRQKIGWLNCSSWVFAIGQDWRGTNAACERGQKVRLVEERYRKNSQEKHQASTTRSIICREGADALGSGAVEERCVGGWKAEAMFPGFANAIDGPSSCHSRQTEKIVDALLAVDHERRRQDTCAH